MIQTCTNTIGSEPNNRYVELLNNLESWRVNKQKKNINRYVQDWWWYPNHKTEGGFYVIYMKHPDNKNDEWYK